jgi:hypothetical protein
LRDTGVQPLTRDAALFEVILKTNEQPMETKPKRRRGGQPGNTNAIKHGRWSRQKWEERARLRAKSHREWMALLKPTIIPWTDTENDQ